MAVNDFDPAAVADLLPPLGLYNQIDEIARLADGGDQRARDFILWFASADDTITIEVPGSLDFEDAARQMTLFTAARAAAHEFETKERHTMVVTVTVGHRE